MTGRLEIADGLSFPLEAVTQTFGILAVRGVGKTYTALSIMEKMVEAGLVACFLDPVGVAWGLRSNAAGDGPGLPVVVFGGDHADVPLTEHSGEKIADILVDERLPMVIDVSRLGMNAQRRFVTEFAEHLYHRNRQPLHLFLDEADVWAPQKPQPGQQRMLGAMEALVRRGRARGLGVTMITQRSAVVNKDILTQIQVLIALRTTSPLDRKAIDGWVEYHGSTEQRAEMMSSLSSLPVGDAWVWSPGWLDVFKRVHIAARSTWDSSATPVVGQVRPEPKSFADVDLERLRKWLEPPAPVAIEVPADCVAAISAATEMVNERWREEVGGLKLRNADLALEVERYRELLSRVWSVGREAVMKIESAQDYISDILNPNPTIIPLDPPLPRFPFGEAQLAAMDRAWDKKISEQPELRDYLEEARSAPKGVEGLRAGARKMLAVLSNYREGLTPIQLGMLSGYSATGGTFQTYLSELKKIGVVTKSGDVLVADEYVEIPAGDRLKRWWPLFRSGGRSMLRHFAEQYPASISKIELGILTGFAPNGGTFQTYLSELKRVQLIDVLANKRMVARDSEFFPVKEGWPVEGAEL